MNLCKISYKMVRKNSDEIYKGFGFKHLSDATQYYVHPNNQSYKGTTTLCHPIGEGISLFACVLDAIMHKGQAIGDYFISDDRGTIFLKVDVPQDWRMNYIVDKNIYSYRALLQGQEMAISAYDANDYKNLMLSYIENPAADTFVNLHEDLYQAPMPQSKRTWPKMQCRLQARPCPVNWWLRPLAYPSWKPLTVRKI